MRGNLSMEYKEKKPEAVNRRPIQKFQFVGFQILQIQFHLIRKENDV